MMENRRSKPSCSNYRTDWWRSVWSIQVPPKVKIFWWSLSWDILPAEMNLARLHIPTPSTCCMCGFAEASSIHAIFLYPLVSKFWKEEGFSIPRGHPGMMGTLEFLDLCLHLNSHRQKEDLVGIAWAIWKKRCELIHMDCSVQSSPKEISCKHVVWAINMIDEYRRVCTRKGAHRTIHGWANIIKDTRRKGYNRIIMCDASFLSNNGKAGAGIVFVDGKGTLVDWRFSELQTCSNSLRQNLRPSF